MRLTLREQYVDVIERRYFGNMAVARPDLILPLLSDGALLTGFFGANDARIVRRHPGAGEESFEHFLDALHADFVLAYSSFIHFVDLGEERCACTFRLEITPRDPRSPVAVRRLRNCNFFQFEAGRIARIAAYFSAPPEDVDPWPTTSSP